MWNKKATWTWADLLYWFFYIPMTAFVILALVIIPTRMQNASVQPTALDAAITNERIFQRAAEYSPILGKTDQPNDNMNIQLFTDKRMAYKIEANGKTFYSNKEKYDDMAPLAPVKYDLYIRKETLGGKQATATTVLPKRYT